MCSTCGCDDANGGYKIFKPGDKIETVSSDHHHNHIHEHGYEHHHHEGDHEHTHSHIDNISIEQDILGANNRMAERNRGYFEAKNILSLNLVSSPGSGKNEHFRTNYS